MPDGAGRLSAGGERKRRLRTAAAFASAMPAALLIEERALIASIDRKVAALNHEIITAAERASAPPTVPDLGTCVRVSLAGTLAPMVEEGVVIEVVPPGCKPVSRRVGRWVTQQKRYVVQCWNRRVVRPRHRLLVVAL